MAILVQTTHSKFSLAFLKIYFDKKCDINVKVILSFFSRYFSCVGAILLFLAFQILAIFTHTKSRMAYILCHYLALTNCSAKFLVPVINLICAYINYENTNFLLALI